MDRDRSVRRRPTRPRRRALMAQAGIGDCRPERPRRRSESNLAGWPAAAKLAEQLRKLEYPSNIVSRQYAAIVAAFSSLSLVRDFADRGSFQNLIFSSPLLEVEMIFPRAFGELNTQNQVSGSSCKSQISNFFRVRPSTDMSSSIRESVD